MSPIFTDILITFRHLRLSLSTRSLSTVSRYIPRIKRRPRGELNVGHRRNKAPDTIHTMLSSCGRQDRPRYTPTARDNVTQQRPPEEKQPPLSGITVPSQRRRQRKVAIAVVDVAIVTAIAIVIAIAIVLNTLNRHRHRYRYRYRCQYQYIVSLSLSISIHFFVIVADIIMFIVIVVDINICCRYRCRYQYMLSLSFSISIYVVVIAVEYHHVYRNRCHRYIFIASSQAAAVIPAD